LSSGVQGRDDVNPTFGEELRRLREERGWSLREMAQHVPHSKSAIQNFEHGLRLPSPKEIQRLDEIMKAGGRLVAAAGRIAGVNGQADRLAHVRKKPRAVDQQSIDTLAGTLAHMRRLEDSFGAQRLLVITAEPLRLVENLADEAAGDIRPAVVDLAGQWAQFAGWLRAAAGKAKPARDYYARALEYAEEVAAMSALPTAQDLIATALSMRGHLAWSARQPGPTVGLSVAAAGKARAPGIRAMALQQEARGHALMHEGSRVDPLLDEAEALMAAAREHPDEEPPWIYFYSPGYLRMQRGLAYRLLGRREDAIEALAAGLETAGPDIAGAEFSAVYKLALAEAHLEGGNKDEAWRLAGEVRATALTTGSSRLAGDLKRLEARLS
jgi:transcriptional regulator with XRE-family HTH domain